MVLENRGQDLTMLWTDEVGMPNPNRQSSKRATVPFIRFVVKYCT